MPSDFYLDQKYRKKQSETTKDLWRAGHYTALVKPLDTKSCLNPECKLPFQTKPYDPKKYCSSSCSAHVNNLQRPRKTHQCLVCPNFTKKFVYKYCSLKCQSLHSYNQYINRWKNGLETGVIGITTKTISAHLRRYLHNKFGNKCSICKWSQVNPMTKIVPLEIDHIDGNSENNKEDNLRLICPNCHALTPSFRNLNKGKGRGWRLAYLKNHRILEG